MSGCGCKEGKAVLLGGTITLASLDNATAYHYRCCKKPAGYKGDAKFVGEHCGDYKEENPEFVFDDHTDGRKDGTLEKSSFFPIYVSSFSTFGQRRRSSEEVVREIIKINRSDLQHESPLIYTKVLLIFAIYTEDDPHALKDLVDQCGIDWCTSPSHDDGHGCWAGTATVPCSCKQGEAVMLGATYTEDNGDTWHHYRCCKKPSGYDGDAKFVGEQCGDYKEDSLQSVSSLCC